MNKRPQRLPPSRSTGLVSASLAATFSFAPIIALAADGVAQWNRVEMRIAALHERLHIVAAQEAQWAVVAAVMRENAVSVARFALAPGPSGDDIGAVGGRLFDGERRDAHALGVKKLTLAFTALYGAMSDAQTREADGLFRDGEGVKGGDETATNSPPAP